MIRTKYIEKSRNPYIVEKEAEFEKVITHEVSSLNDIYLKFKDYKFEEYLDEFRQEFNCQTRCHVTFYLIITNQKMGIYFGRFLVSSIHLPDRNEVEFTSIPCYDDRGNPSEEVNDILQDELYDEVKVGAKMEIKFITFCSLDALSEYEAEQLEDHYDEGDDEEDNLLPSPPIETPFVFDECSICLTEKPNIIMVPCLHQSVCIECEEAGKLTKCPTCREMIIKKIKI